jgi:hypothetical protein
MLAGKDWKDFQSCFSNFFRTSAIMQYYVIESFVPFFWTYFQTFFKLFFRFFFELPPFHPLDSPPTICKLCPINNYNIFFDLFFELSLNLFFKLIFELFFELFSNFLQTTSLSSLSPLQQFVIKAQFNYLIINFNKKQ